MDAEWCPFNRAIFTRPRRQSGFRDPVASADAHLSPPHLWRVGVTVLAGGAGEIENVSQVFQPDGRFAAANSP